MAVFAGTFSARPYNLRVHVTENSRDQANNRSNYNVVVDVISNSGYGTYRSDAFTATVTLAGNDTSLTRASGLQFPPDYTGKVLTVGSFTTDWISHDSAGYLSFGVRVRSSGSYGVFGSADSGTQTFTATRIPKAPSKPPAPVFQSVDVSSISFTRSTPSDNGGSAITTYEFQAATDSGFTSIAQAWTSTATNQTASPLSPGTQHWLRYRAVNSVGPGPWSDSITATTPSSTAPGLTVDPNMSGESATLTLSTPGGGSVTKYHVERRLVGGSASTFEFTISPFVISSLIPGATYEWRASAFYGTYQTPWSVWLAVTQPNPNLTPGEYFDGASPARDDIFYRWAGAAHGSASSGVAYRPKGWSASAGTSGGSVNVHRATGGRSGDFAARVLILESATAAGLHAGTELAAPGAHEVEVGGGYGALIHVRIPDRAQRMAAMIVWLNAGFVEIGRSIGESILVQASSTSWTALRVSGEAPAGAEWGAVRVIDVAGSGWAPWVAGDSFLLDDATTPFDSYYFDGNTPDTDDYIYEWEGLENESPSTRANSTELRPDPLADPNCPAIPPPPRAPQVEDLCVGEPALQWRRIWVEVESFYINSIAWSVPTLKIHADQSVSSLRVRYLQNPFNRPLSDLEQDDYCGEQLISYLPGGTTLTIDGVSERVWAEVEGSPDSLAADHLVSGRDSLRWPLLGCGISYYIVVDIPLDMPADAVRVEYSITQRY